MKFFIMLCLGLLLGMASCGPKHVSVQQPPLVTGEINKTKYYIYQGNKPEEYLVFIQGVNKKKDVQDVMQCVKTVCITDYMGEIYHVERYPSKK